MRACLADAPWCVYMSHRSRLSYFAVFDGHGGARASRYAAENLHHNLAKKFPSGAFHRSSNIYAAPNVFFIEKCTRIIFPTVIFVCIYMNQSFVMSQRGPDTDRILY